MAQRRGTLHDPPNGKSTIGQLTTDSCWGIQKETVYNHIKQLQLPFTIIDVGWWYQLSYPRLESGRADYAMTSANNEIVGDGNTPLALTDLRDIGRYVALIINDDRTLNKMVLAYNTVLTQNQIYDMLEEISEEKIQRNYVSCSGALLQYRPG